MHAAIDRLDQAAADAIGVSRNDLRCLNLLEHGPLTPGDLAGKLGLTTGSVTALLDRLEKRGLIARHRHDQDRRSTCVSATPLVFETLAPVYRGFALTLQQEAQKLTEAEQQQAVEVLNLVTSVCLKSVEMCKPPPAPD